MTALLLLAALSAGPVTAVQVRVYAPGVVPGVGAPLREVTVPLGDVTCGAAPIAPAQPQALAGASGVEFDDPARPGLVCRVLVPALFEGLGQGLHRVGVALVDDAGAASPVAAAPDALFAVDASPSDPANYWALVLWLLWWLSFWR